jgi:hypothetical protein
MIKRQCLFLLLLLLCIAMRDRVVNSSAPRPSFTSANIAAGASYEEYDFDPPNAKRRNLTLGKDRELFYASVDFKWLVQRLTNVDCLIGLGKKALLMLLNLVRGADPDEASRKNALEIWSYIRNVQKTSNIR